MARMTYAQLAAENAALRHNYEMLEARLHQANQRIAALIIPSRDTAKARIQTSPL